MPQPHLMRRIDRTWRALSQTPVPANTSRDYLEMRIHGAKEQLRRDADISGVGETDCHCSRDEVPNTDL